jgi:hypothetical protein
VTILVLALNFVIKYLVQYLINNIGYHTESQRNASVQLVTFISSFINTGLIPLLTNAEFKYNKIVSWIPLNSNYADFDSDWYVFLGPQIVQTIAILAFMPYVGILISIL